MIAANTSTRIAFLEGERGQDAQMLDKALEERQVLMVPTALTEITEPPEATLRSCRPAFGGTDH